MHRPGIECDECHKVAVYGEANYDFMIKEIPEGWYLLIQGPSGMGMGVQIPQLTFCSSECVIKWVLS